VPTRRKFLFDCSALLAGTLTAPTVAIANSADPFARKRRLVKIAFAALASQVNTPFWISGGPGTVIEVTLAEATLRRGTQLRPGNRPPPDTGSEEFSLIFSGARRDLITQNTYSITHRNLGSFELFLVPIYTRNPGKINYQAIVNRPRNHSRSEN
jgi:hypothetical protein